MILMQHFFKIAKYFRDFIIKVTFVFIVNIFCHLASFEETFNQRVNLKPFCEVRVSIFNSGLSHIIKLQKQS